MNFGFALLVALGGPPTTTPTAPPSTAPAMDAPAPEPPPAPAPPPMVGVPAPAPAPAAAPAPAPLPRQLPPPPPNGAGAIIGGSILAGLGGVATFGLGITCAIVCPYADGARPYLLGGVAVSALTLGGGIALEVSGFNNFESAMRYELATGVPVTARPGQIKLGAMLGGFFTASFFGLIAGGVTGAVYQSRYSDAYMQPRRARLRFAPLVTPRVQGVALGGRF